MKEESLVSDYLPQPETPINIALPRGYLSILEIRHI